jgi:predicted O-methyltransferase YrrM
MLKLRKLAPRLPRAEAERFVQSLYRGLLHRDADAEGLSHWAGQLMAGIPASLVLEAILGSEEYHSLQGAPLFVPPGHFYSPICDLTEAAAHLASVRATAPQTLPGLAINRAAMVRTWHTLLPFLQDAPFSDTRTEGFRYWYDNPSYAWGDGSILHAMLRLHRPRRLIEIGSGWSSACTLDTVERYLAGDCALTFIDPYPQLVRELLGDVAAHARILECRVQDVPLETFDALAVGDVLFIDSTHVLRTGSDVCRELFEILPRLAPGVLVHIHDMFWPFEYSHDWVVGENRSWNELQAVRAFLIGNADWEVVWFNDYMAQLERPLLEATYPRMLRNSGGALWLRRR